MALLSVRSSFLLDSNAGTWKRESVTLVSFHSISRRTRQTQGRLLFTFPWGNFFRKPSCLLVTPNSKAASTLTSAPLYWAAMSALYARKLLGYVYRVWKTTRWLRCERDGRDKPGYGTGHLRLKPFSLAVRSWGVRTAYVSGVWVRVGAGTCTAAGQRDKREMDEPSRV